ncbi:MAG: hypothetical protein KF833_00405 [Verrucomicrobiae bacterium]|nr:hypothetical protein [Verrucomicrobiae bacterium]
MHHPHVHYLVPGGGLSPSRCRGTGCATRVRGV